MQPEPFGLAEQTSKGTSMATETTATAKTAATETTSVGVELVPSNDSDRPVLSNFVTLQPASGVALIDFGFLEPGAVAAMSQMARSGKKLPERIKGRLAARVALSYDVLANLHQQSSRLLQAMTAAAATGKPAEKK
jgi:hypothetical protein